MTPHGPEPSLYNLGSLASHWIDATVMRRTKKPPPANVLVTGERAVTGEQYLKVHQKLGIDLGRYLTRLGMTMKDHYLVCQDLSAPLNDPGQALHVRLLDRYPELVEPDPLVEDLVSAIKDITRESPGIDLPMRPTAGLVSLLLGRNQATATTWLTRRATPSWKTVELIRDLLKLLDTHPDVAGFLEEYCETARAEARARGIEDVFKTRKW